MIFKLTRIIRESTLLLNHQMARQKEKDNTPINCRQKNKNPFFLPCMPFN